MHHPFLTSAHTHDKTFKKPAHPLSPPLAQSTHWPATPTSLPQHLACLARLITDLFKSAFPSLPPHWRANLTASSSTPGRVYLSLPCLPLDALQTLIGPSQSSSALSLERFSSYALSPLPCKINQIHLWLCHPLDPLHPTEGLGILIRQAYKHCSRLASHWLPQLPPWYEKPLFHQWNQQRLKDLNPSQPRAEAHPFHHHLLHSLLSSKPPLITITNPLNPSDPPLKTKINISTDLINHLWSQHLDPVCLQQSYPQIAQSYAQNHANTWLQALASKWTPDFLNSMAVSDQATWHTILWSTFQRTCRHKYYPSEQEAPLIDALKKALRTHQHNHAALLCKQELPLLLKDYYPLARKLNRTIKVVLGPTNSGKTHAALEALSHAKSGSYLGPLRLLALEVYDRLNDDYNIPTSLITGEQVQLKTLDGYPAAHKACTVEMLDFTTPQDVIVIDEAQMVQDPHRGSAWLHAILGAPAKTLYILGSPEARPALEHLLKSTGEQYSIEIKNRLSAQVVVDPQPASSYNVPPSSAIIAFSRKKVLEIAEYLKSKGQTPAVIYGSLPPDVRRKQSELFSTGQAPVLVATDAIGLGLNLPISRIYFSSTVKSNGVREELLDPHLLWQIAGRAGRFGHSEAGSIHAFNPSDLAYIRECLSSRPEPLNGQFYCNLTTPIAEKIAEHLATSKLASVYAFFKDYIELTTSTRTIVSNVTDEQLMLAKLLDQQPSLSLSEKLLLSNAPAIYRDLDPHFHGFVQAISKNKEYPTQALLRQLTPSPHTPLADLETTIKTLNLWAWLHYRFEHVFLHRQQVLELQNTINQRIHTLLLSNAKKTASHRTARSGSHFKSRRP